MESKSKAYGCGGESSMDKEILNRIQESHQRAKAVLETSKLALCNQNKTLQESLQKADLTTFLNKVQNAKCKADFALSQAGLMRVYPQQSKDNASINISDLMSDKTVILGGNTPKKDRMVFDPREMSDQSTLSTSVLKETLKQRQSSIGGQQQQPCIAKERTVDDILQSSRSQKVRRMSTNRNPDVCGLSSNKLKVITDSIQNLSTEEIFYQGEELLKQILDKDEANFKLCEIPVNFQEKSPPKLREKCNLRNQTSPSRAKDHMPIELDDFAGPGYLCSNKNQNDFSLNSYCNKQSEELDNMIQQQQQRNIPLSTTSNRELIEIDETMQKETDGSGTCPLTLGSGRGVSKITDTLKNVKDGDTTNYLIQKLISDETNKNCSNITEASQMSFLDSMLKAMDLNNIVASCAPNNENAACSRNVPDTPINANNKRVRVQSMDCPPNVDQHKTLIQEFCERKRNVQLDTSPNIDECRLEPRNNNNKNNNNNNTSSAISINSVSPCCSMTLPANSNNNNNSSKSTDFCDLKRASSQMSTLSEFNYMNGFLPLKSTHNELSWGSVKLRKPMTKAFQVKNTAPKRLVVRVILDGPGFQFENPEANQKGTITLQPNEVRSMSIVFNPTVIGPAVGNVIFQPPVDMNSDSCVPTMSNINSKVTKRIIRLFGYGGHVQMSFDKLQQGPVGSKFLPLGSLGNLCKVFEETFIIRNKGPLAGFASIMLESKSMGKSFFDNSVKIVPEKVIVPPNSTSKIKVSFTPSGTDFRELIDAHRNSEVITVGNLLMITGDEPTRCRIKKLITSCKDLAAKYSAPQLQTIWSDFGKGECIYDLKDIKESGMALSELLCSFQTKEVSLTVNNSVTDVSLLDASGWLNDYEDTTEFHTIYHPPENGGSPQCSRNGQCNLDIDDLDGSDISELKRCNSGCQKEEWWVEPTVLEFEMNCEAPKRLAIHSNVIKDRMFEVDSNVADYFSVCPQEGVLRQVTPTNYVTVRMINFNPCATPLFIYIYIENDRLAIPVQVTNCGSSCPDMMNSLCVRQNCQ